MANELQLTLRATWDIGVVEGSLPPGFAEALGIDVAGTKLLHNVQSVGTLKEPLDLADVGSGGYMILRNIDDTNYVAISGSVSPSCVPLVRLKPGDVALFRLSAGAPYAQANTATVELEYWLLEA